MLQRLSLSLLAGATIIAILTFTTLITAFIDQRQREAVAAMLLQSV